MLIYFNILHNLSIYYGDIVKCHNFKPIQFPMVKFYYKNN